MESYKVVMGKKNREKLGSLASFPTKYTTLKNPGGNMPQNGSCPATCLSSHEPFKKDEQDMRGTAGKPRTN